MILFKLRANPSHASYNLPLSFAANLPPEFHMPQVSKIALAITVAFGVFASPQAGAAAFTPGNLVVYRVSDGTATLINTGNAVFLDEYSISQAGGATLVQSIAMPTVAADGDLQRQCLASGTAASEGLMTRSPNGEFLALTCYGRNLLPTGAVLTGTTASAVPRVIARVTASGAVDTSTALTDFASLNNPRSAVTDGTGFWAVGGSGGVRYATLGQTTSTDISTTITNLRQIDIVGGNLWVSHASGMVFTKLVQIGTGLTTTTGQVMTSIAGFPTATGLSFYGFVFVDLDTTVGGVDTAYTAADGAAGSVQKWSLVGGTWTLTGTVTTIAQPAGALVNPRSLIGRNIPGTGVALATVADGANIVVGIDTAGYNVAPAILFASVVNAGANKAFRGLAPAPEAAEVAFEFKNGFEDALPPLVNNRILW
jgi:hypothetical protein